MKTDITPELIRAALQFIPANLARDEWARVAMAIKSEFPDATGFELFDIWSQGSDGYAAKATRGTWQSVKAGGAVGIGTLLHLAKEQGFKLPKADQAAVKPDPEALARREREQAQTRQQEKARIEAAHDSAASEAAAQWAQASETGTSAYLTRKGVQPYGARFTSAGVVLVPVRDAAGALWNLQCIASDKPTDGSTDKLFLKGGRKSGLWHMLGDVGSDAAGLAVLLVAEGYATAASLHEATGRPVAVAFDAGNLAHVAKALRTLYPSALLVLCGDDDLSTLARTGKNPGRTAAIAAACAVHGLAVFPAGLLDGGSDFNDLHQYHGGAAGLEAVRCIVEDAIDNHQASQTTAQTAQAPKAGKGRPARQNARYEASAGHGDTARAFDVFAVNDDGVWHQGID